MVAEHGGQTTRSRGPEPVLSDLRTRTRRRDAQEAGERNPRVASGCLTYLTAQMPE